MPEVNSVYKRSDNAGCYHCAFTLLSVYHVAASKHAIELKRFDFSDPQGGKGSCDRKAAPIKSQMRTHLNCGHDIETASQMMTAIESSGGISDVRVTVSGSQPAEKSTPVKFDLTPLQIAGFFSRLSAKKTYSVEQSSEEEGLERNELITEKAFEEMSNEVTKALALQHPIMYETYNICEIVGQPRLAKFSIRTMQNICAALELDVASMTGKRKQPYMEIIEGIVARCGCISSKAD